MHPYKRSAAYYSDESLEYSSDDPEIRSEDEEYESEVSAGEFEFTRGNPLEASEELTPLYGQRTTTQSYIWVAEIHFGKITEIRAFKSRNGAVRYAITALNQVNSVDANVLIADLQKEKLVDKSTSNARGKYVANINKVLYIPQ